MDGHICDKCNRPFGRKSLLDNHKKTDCVNNKRIYRNILRICNTCGKEFSRADSLKRHLLVHQKEKADEEKRATILNNITKADNHTISGRIINAKQNGTGHRIGDTNITKNTHTNNSHNTTTNITNNAPTNILNINIYGENHALARFEYDEVFNIMHLTTDEYNHIFYSDKDIALAFFESIFCSPSRPAYNNMFAMDEFTMIVYTENGEWKKINRTSVFLNVNTAFEKSLNNYIFDYNRFIPSEVRTKINDYLQRIKIKNIRYMHEKSNYKDFLIKEMASILIKYTRKHIPDIEIYSEILMKRGMEYLFSKDTVDRADKELRHTSKTPKRLVHGVKPAVQISPATKKRNDELFNEPFDTSSDNDMHDLLEISKRNDELFNEPFDTSSDNDILSDTLTETSDTEISSEDSSKFRKSAKTAPVIVKKKRMSDTEEMSDSAIASSSTSSEPSEQTEDDSTNSSDESDDQVELSSDNDPSSTESSEEAIPKKKQMCKKK